jgi:hypothetical protein
MDTINTLDCPGQDSERCGFDPSRLSTIIQSHDVLIIFGLGWTIIVQAWIRAEQFWNQDWMK